MGASEPMMKYSYESSSEEIITINIGIIGFGPTGKTTLVKHLCGKEYSCEYFPNAVTDMFEVDEKYFKLRFLDKSGDENIFQFYLYTSVIYIYIDMFIIVVSPDQPNSLETFKFLSENMSSN